MLKNTVLIALVGCGICCNAQWANNNWVFGHRSAITFNSGLPVSIGPMQLEVGEGCSAISDAYGELVLYTDGDTVFDRFQSHSPNGTGLLAGNTSTQGTLIVQKPGSEHIYFILTAPSAWDANGLVYSEFDRNLNGGSGDITAVKNIQLLANSTEKLTGVLHDNEIDSWVVAHEFGTDAFYFFLVNSFGIGSTINVSNIGSIISGPNELKQGYMRISLDGTMLAMTNDVLGKVELFHLNNEFGFLNNALVLEGFSGAYGLEFSPNDQKLYLTRENTLNTPVIVELFQFDLTYWNEDSIMNSAIVIDTLSGQSRSTLCLAPNGVIYTSQNIKNYIGAILEPDLDGQSCQFVDSALVLTPPGFSRIGLPNFIKEPLDPSLNIGQTPVQEEILKAWWVDGSLNFELLQMPEKNWDLSVHDLAGRKVAELKGRSEKAWQIPTTEWNTAVYVWRWNNGKESRFGKVYVH